MTGAPWIVDPTWSDESVWLGRPEVRRAIFDLLDLLEQYGPVVSKDEWVARNGGRSDGVSNARNGRVEQRWTRMWRRIRQAVRIERSPSDAPGDADLRAHAEWVGYAVRAIDTWLVSIPDLPDRAKATRRIA